MLLFKVPFGYLCSYYFHIIFRICLLISTKKLLRSVTYFSYARILERWTQVSPLVLFSVKSPITWETHKHTHTHCSRCWRYNNERRQWVSPSHCILSDPGDVWWWRWWQYLILDTLLCCSSCALTQRKYHYNFPHVIDQIPKADRRSTTCLSSHDRLWWTWGPTQVVWPLCCEAICLGLIPRIVGVYTCCFIIIINSHTHWFHKWAGLDNKLYGPSTSKPYKAFVHGKASGNFRVSQNPRLQSYLTEKWVSILNNYWKCGILKPLLEIHSISKNTNPQD